jgi:hypothetical protein
MLLSVFVLTDDGDLLLTPQLMRARMHGRTGVAWLPEALSDCSHCRSRLSTANHLIQPDLNLDGQCL